MTIQDDLLRVRETTHATNEIAMISLLRRLFAEAPKLDATIGVPDQGQRPAMLCQVVLRTLPTPLSGVLSTTEEGLLKLMTPVAGKTGEPPVLMEQFFAISDLMLVAVDRHIKPSTSLWTPSS